MLKNSKYYDVSIVTKHFFYHFLITFFVDITANKRNLYNNILCYGFVNIIGNYGHYRAHQMLKRLILV